MKIAIIPARGGSEIIKNKNIKLFLKRPIIFLTIKILKKMNFFNKIIVSTDSQKIMNICKKKGIEEIILRPKKLGHRKITTNKVINHAIKNLEKNYKFKYVCCVYPCNPFLHKKNIIKSFKMIKNKQDLVFPLSEYPVPIQKAIHLRKDKVSHLNKSAIKKNTQEFEKSFHDAGQFYFGTKHAWKSNKKNLKGFVLKKYTSVDIDYPEDWKFAEFLYKNKFSK